MSVYDTFFPFMCHTRALAAFLNGRLWLTWLVHGTLGAMASKLHWMALTWNWWEGGKELGRETWL